MPSYTYSIFDSNPHVSGHALPQYDELEIEADDDDDAAFSVELKLASAAAGCAVEDGYSVGDCLYALAWDAAGLVVADITHTLTSEDLGD